MFKGRFALFHMCTHKLILNSFLMQNSHFLPVELPKVQCAFGNASGIFMEASKLQKLGGKARNMENIAFLKKRKCARRSSMRGRNGARDGLNVGRRHQFNKTPPKVGKFIMQFCSVHQNDA